jgi:hypothetical protein
MAASIYMIGCVGEQEKAMATEKKEKLSRVWNAKRRKNYIGPSKASYQSLRHKSCSMLLAFKEDCCQETMRRPLENTRSDDALVAGMARKRRAIIDNFGNVR